MAKSGKTPETKPAAEAVEPNIPEGWKVMAIEGRGVVVQGDTGMIFVPGATLEDGRVVASEETGGVLTITPPAATRGPTDISGIGVRAFLQEMQTKNLNRDGEYGPLGPHLRKLQEVLRGVQADSELESLFSTFLKLGNHQRHGMAAAVMNLKDDDLNALSKVLDTPEPDIVEDFVDRCVLGAA